MKPRSGGKKPKAAKAPKAGRKKTAVPDDPKPGKAPESVKPSEVRGLTPAKTLTDLLRTCKGLKVNADSIMGELREKIAYAKEHKHLNTKAFGWLRQLDRMEPEKLAAFWGDLEAYMDATGIMERIESVGSLPLEQRDDETETTAARKPRAGNGSKPKPATEPVASIQPAASGQSTGEVSKPHFGQAAPPAAQAPGGTVHMLPQAAGSKH